MKGKNDWRRFIMSLMIVLLLHSSQTTALARQAIDPAREASLTICFNSGSGGLGEVEFRLYRVADISEAAHFTLTGDFAEYPVAVNNLDSSGWRALAQTLNGYVSRDSIEPLQSAVTGNDGKVIFDPLPAGLYLAIGSRCRDGNAVYTPEPFLVSLPNLDEETDEWIYDAAIVCKYDKDTDDTVNRKVLKVWNDEGNEDSRPREITVQLLKDGEVYDTVVLNENNNWRYSWSDLDNNYQWLVTEYETPDGYTVSVEREGTAFVMTNTCTEESPDTPAGDDNHPNRPGGTDAKLPQTGMLWWPVPLLACAGLLLFLAGWRVRQHEKK